MNVFLSIRKDAGTYFRFAAKAMIANLLCSGNKRFTAYYRLKFCQNIFLPKTCHMGIKINDDTTNRPSLC